MKEKIDIVKPYRPGGQKDTLVVTIPKEIRDRLKMDSVTTCEVSLDEEKEEFTYTVVRRKTK